MSKIQPAILNFNRGVISPLALARVDLERTKLSAEVQTNYVPRTLGSRMLRVGTEYIATTKSSNTARYIPFVFATDDTAYIEVSDSNVRVFVDDTAITRTSVSTAITNGTFDSDVTSWTDADEGSVAASSWLTGGYMALLGTGFDAAIRRQQVTVGASDQGILHGLRVTVERGPVEILVGTTSGNDDYFSQTLGTGVHSLAFTPTGNFWLEFKSTKSYTVLVDSVSVEASGVQDLPSPWAEADLNNMRWDQSADVIFVSSKNIQQRRIERRGTTSWSIVKYEPEDGPFRNINTTGITLTPSAISGDITLTASAAYFKSTNLGSLFKIDSIGQTVTLAITAENQFTDGIRVTGVDNSRIFDIDITGTWSATVVVQRSVGEEGNWSDVSSLSYTTNQNTTHDDGLDNQIIFYRIGVKTGGFTSGTATVTLSYGSGSNAGVARVTAFNSATSVDAVVLDAFGGTDASSNWFEGDWSARRGYPTAVALYESRLSWAGKSKVWLSQTDGLDIFDDSIEGDSGPISRTIGQGPVDGVNWIFAGSRLVLGTDSTEASIRSSSFDEPLTPTAFQIKYPSNQGSANVPIVKVDGTGIFVQRGTTTVYKLAYSGAPSYEYTSGEVTTLTPEIGLPSIERIAAQRQPDTRIHCVRGDGKVALWLTDPAEDVSCWILIETDGVVEDVFVMPTGTVEDRVYYLVKRTINGVTKRYLEKWALESEAQGGTLNKQADSFITYTGSSTTSITGLDHLEAETVVAWVSGSVIATKTVTDGQITGLTDNTGGVVVVRNAANTADFGILEVDSDGVIDGLLTLEGSSVEVRTTGKSLGSYTVASGQITLSEATTDAVVGLGYRARYKSVKLASGSEQGSALLQRKGIPQIGFVLSNTYKDGVKYGPSFTELDDMPSVEDEQTVPDDKLWGTYDKEAFKFNGTWNTDSRVCLQSQAPKPATIMAVVIGMKTNEKI